jgi:hypothetical protein
MATYALTALPTYAPPNDPPQAGGPIVGDLYDARIWSSCMVNGVVWACHHITTTGSPGEATRVRWYQINLNGWPTSGSVPTLAQYGDIAPEGKWSYTPSIAADETGNAVVTYTESSSTQWPAMRRAARRATSPTGTMPDDQLVKASDGPWNPPPPNGRWADYSGTDPDPSRRCTFYGHHEWADDVDPGYFRNWLARYNVCPGDFDASGTIELADLAAYGVLFQQGDPEADVDTDGVLTTTDFVIAQNWVIQGAP